MSSDTPELSLLEVPQRPGFSRTISSNSQISINSTKSAKSGKSFSSSLFHEKDKPRLYLGLFPRGGTTPTYSSQLTCDTYHWAIVIGSKSPLRSEAGKAYHLVHAPATDGTENRFYYTETDLCENTHENRSLMVRIAIGKVLDIERVEELLRSIKLPSSPASSVDSESDHSSTNSNDHNHDLSCSYTCLNFCKTAYELLTDPPRTKSSSSSSYSSRPLKCYFGPSDWDDIEARARKYVKRKRQQGRFREGGTRNYLLGGPATWSPDEVATFNFWENRETTD